MRRLAVAAFVAALLLVLLPATAEADETTLVDGLAGPLGLAVGADGTVYVTEAFGPGRLLAVDRDGDVDTVFEEPGTELTGVDATGKGKVVFTETVYGPDEVAVEAHLSRAKQTGADELADTLAYEQANNPDAGNTYGFVAGASAECLEQFAALGIPPVYEGIVDSHPYAVAISPPGYVVADAAANAILEVSNSGRISTLAVLPPIPQVITPEAAAEFGIPACVDETYYGEPVPTDVEVGPGGDLYVSLLPGAPEVPGAGQVWRVDRRTGDLSFLADGFAGAVDLAVARDGTVYVAELFASQISVISGGTVSPFLALDTPGAIEIGRDGTLYATTGVFGPAGAVVAITP